MRVALAPHYRIWLLALLPTTLGVGTLLLWLRSLNWPQSIDAGGITLRYRRYPRRVPWHSIRNICVSCSYLDGHVKEMRLHYADGTSKIPVDSLQGGQEVVRTILAMFEQTGGSGEYIPARHVGSAPHLSSYQPHARQPTQTHATLAGQPAEPDLDGWGQELAMLQLTLQRRAMKLRSAA